MEKTQLNLAYHLLENAARACTDLQNLNDEQTQKLLGALADALETHATDIITANQQDLSRMEFSNPKYDRLKLTVERLADIAADMRNVARLDSPLGKVLAEHQRPNGLIIQKLTVPFGVIGVIYEARPNVTCDVFSLCMKSGNVCVLKGSSDADETNQTLVRVIHEVLKQYQINPDICTLLPSTRTAAQTLLNAVGLVDLVIPRGSSALIQFVRNNARIPVIETGAGICHTYFDEYGDKDKGRIIIHNAKTRRVSVCNALDCLIIHQKRLDDLPFLCDKLHEDQVIIYADKPAYEALSGRYPSHLLVPSSEEHYGTEFLDYKMSIRTVPTFSDALKHIARYSSKHSECIVSESAARIDEFNKRVDAACVYANASTAFTDGAQFGFGAEIGISTQKLHARGPMALPELTTYKYIISGDGQIRKK